MSEHQNDPDVTDYSYLRGEPGEPDEPIEQVQEVLLAARLVLHLDGQVEVITDPTHRQAYAPALGARPPLNQLLMALNAAADDLRSNAVAQLSLHLQMQAAQQMQQQQAAQQIASKLQIPGMPGR